MQDALSDDGPLPSGYRAQSTQPIPLLIIELNADDARHMIRALTDDLSEDRPVPVAGEIDTFWLNAPTDVQVGDYLWRRSGPAMKVTEPPTVRGRVVEVVGMLRSPAIETTELLAIDEAVKVTRAFPASTEGTNRETNDLHDAR